MNRLSSVLSVGFVFFVAAPFAKAEDLVAGTATSHNGTTNSDPAGSGAVNVYLDYGSMLGTGPHRAVYHELATHEVAFTYSPGPTTNMYNTSFFWNETGVPWTAFVIRLEGADFAGHGGGNAQQARADAPVVDGGIPYDPSGIDADQIGLRQYIPGRDFSLLDSEITRFNPEGSGFTDAELTVSFDDPVQDGCVFALYYNVIPSPGAATPAEFTMYVTPVPEPATAALLTVGTLLIALTRRRSRAFC